MTQLSPKEKAKELVDKFDDAGRFNSLKEDWQKEDVLANMKLAKHCALIAVEEIKQEVYQSEASTARYNYWQDVKTEIEKL